MIPPVLRAALSCSIGLAAMGLAAPAHADPRLVDRLFDPDQVVKIEGKANVQTTIKFGENETIENVAIGDASKWQVTPNRRADLLFVKPLADRAATNMTVVTSKHTYLFDLVASPGHRNPLYVLAFDYPQEVEEAPELASADPAAQPSTVELAAASDPYAVLDPAELNFEWASQGVKGLLPERIFDDGDATFLSWPFGTPMPAILMRDRDGVEGPVNFAVRGDVIVVDGVPREIILRSGEEVATLTNEGPVRPTRSNPSTLAQIHAGPGADNAEAK